MRISNRILIGLGIVAMVGGAGYLGINSRKPAAVDETPATVRVDRCDVEQTITAPGVVQAVNLLAVEIPVESRIEEILVEVGQQVQAGQPLARLADLASINEKMASANYELLKAQNELDTFYREAGKTAAQNQIDLLEAQKKRGEVEYKLARMDSPKLNQGVLNRLKDRLAENQASLDAALDDYMSLMDRDISDPDRIKALKALDTAQQYQRRAKENLLSYVGEPNAEKFAQAVSDVENARAEEAKILAKMKRSTHGLDPLAEAELKARVEKARADFETLQRLSKDGEVLAPAAGIVTEIKGEPGVTYSANEILLRIIDPSVMLVKATITEEDYPLVQIGQKVELFYDALPEDIYSGRVERAVPVRVTSDKAEYAIYVRLDTTPAGLVDGMTADTAVQIAASENALCLPRAVVHASSSDQATIKVWNGSQAEERQIKIGLRGDTAIEILSGLTEGEEVISR
jgi:HlyD family secretion protein